MNDNAKHRLTATEALYGFAGWLTSRTQPVTISARLRSRASPRFVGLIFGKPARSFN